MNFRSLVEIYLFGTASPVEKQHENRQLLNMDIIRIDRSGQLQARCNWHCRWHRVISPGESMRI